jgi:hypothetical protein
LCFEFVEQLVTMIITEDASSRDAFIYFLENGEARAEKGAQVVGVPPFPGAGAVLIAGEQATRKLALAYAIMLYRGGAAECP